MLTDLPEVEAKASTDTNITEPEPTAAPAPTETTKKAKPVTPAKKTLSMSRALKDVMVKSPKTTVDELVARLEAMGFKGRSKVTIATLRSDCLTTLAAARDAGLYSVEME